MTQKEKQLLLRDLCARLPHKVKCFAKDNEYGDIGTLYSVDSFENLDPNIYIQYDKGNVISFFISEIKPYLRPMSSMTEEEFNEYESIKGWRQEYELIDWLNKKMFDYRGLIEKNLALEASKDMYDSNNKVD